MSPSSPHAVADDAHYDFPITEYQTRIATIQQQLRARGDDLLLVDQIDNIAYLFGYLATAARYQAALIPASGKPWLIVRELDLGTFLDQSWARDYETFADDEDSLAIIAAAVARFAPNRLAVEKDSNITTIERLDAIKAANPQAEITDFSALIWEQRLIKSPREISYIEKACAIADATVLAARESLQAGRLDSETLADMYEAAIRQGADNTRTAILGRRDGRDALIGSVKRSRWQAGETLFLEATIQYRGYSGRIVRPAVIGPLSADAKARAARLLAIQDAQIAAMQVGASAHDVDALAREAVLAQGIKDSFTQITAYTLGYQAVPRVSDHTRILAPAQYWTFAAGMVLHVVLHDHEFAFSETVLITETGPRRLTQLAREVLA